MFEITDEIAIQQINGSVDRGGWELRLSSLSPRTNPDYPVPYDPVTGNPYLTRSSNLLSRWQNVAVKWHGGFGACPGAERCAFNGWALPTRVQFSRTGSQTDIVCQTSDGFLRRGWIQGISFEDVGSGARLDYHQFDAAHGNMTLGRIVKHILGYYDTGDDLGPHWVAHTNMVYHPIEATGEGNPHGWISLDNVETLPYSAAYRVGSAQAGLYNVRETDNLWSRLREIARNEFFVICFDKTDTLWYKPDPMYLFNPPGLPTPVMTFDQDFCLTPPTVQLRDIESVQQVRLAAVTDTGDTLHSNYPTSPIPTYGKVLDISRIRCNNQSQLDDCAHRKYNFENRLYTVTWSAPGLCGLLFELLDRVQITYTGTAANGVHLDWNKEKFWIYDITVIPDRHGSGISRFMLESEGNPIEYT